MFKELCWFWLLYRKGIVDSQIGLDGEVKMVEILEIMSGKQLVDVCLENSWWV